MKTYRFLGTVSEINGYPKLERYGQAFNLPEELARELMADRGLFIPEEDFRAIGFTDQELIDHQYISSHVTAPAAFLDKKRRASLRLDAIREELNRPAMANKNTDAEGGE